ncbi:hypothetical protein ANCCEY_12830 [Ancylostoma ceylanicum]|uniref:Hexosyltransferase n=1 Tax=Ancylostoma ceylanicum TaxID=53326 RepID=A0A0D6LA81_9BILA|nr:hypothetical protein ANCCEY_12830 [Ancylostoma ceylanicum]
MRQLKGAPEILNLCGGKMLSTFSTITLIFQNIVRAHPRHLRFTLVAVIFLCILCFGIISVNRTSNGTAIMRDRSVEAANIKAREMFGNVPFPDPRLQLLNFTIVPNRRKCVKKDFVVVVHIRVEDQLGRNRWRQTYGDPQLMHKFMYTLVFSVGFPNSTKEQDKLKNESRVHEDVLQADYIDAYRNLTLKQLAELRFFTSSCENVKAVVKLDDDVGWNVEKTAQFIRNNLATNEIYCARRANHTPIFRRGSKW